VGVRACICICVCVFMCEKEIVHMGICVHDIVHVDMYIYNSGKALSS